MSPDRWQEVKKIFYEALDLPAGEREHFVRRICGDDESLREEIEILLASSIEAENFIETPALTRLADLVTDEKALDGRDNIGKQIGAYKIEREIGRGGMGAVYLAVRADREFEKKVAVKLIKRGFDTDEIIKRFRYERQILAALEHAFITRLVDGGSTDDGLPYLVMDYVEGLPLNRYCHEKALSINERLKLFLQICAAVSYAHQNLIVHRDLKPSNILITPDGVPKLLDFGIAKLVAPNAGTQTFDAGQTAFRALTPEYASPEQINGQAVTTASDIYSLGVILYELLTGRRPFLLKNRKVEEMSRIITDTSPPKPSEASILGSEAGRKSEDEPIGGGKIPPSVPLLPFSLSQLKGDLDNIILLAMRKEPERRYSSVEQFAEDIRRYLGGLPVIAREDTFGYRASKFVSRNKAGVAAGLGIALSLVGGLIATARQAKIAKKQRDKAVMEAEKAEKINLFLQKMLNSADPREQGKDVKLIEVLGEASKSIETDFAASPEIIADLSTTIGKIYLSLSFLDLAEKHLKTALDIRLSLFPRQTPEVAMSLYHYGRLGQARGDLNSAEPLYREALETLRRLGKELEVAEVLDNLGYLLALKGKNREAIRIHSEELEIRRALFGDHHAEVAKTLRSLANVFGLVGEREKAEAFHRKALAILRNFYKDDHPDVITGMSRLAASILWRDKSEAERLFYRVLELRRKNLGENHPDVAWTLYDLAFLNAERGDFTEGEKLARRSLSMRGTNLTDEHPVTSSALLILGRCLLGQNQPDTAKLALEECLELRRRTLSENHWLLATANSFYGECLMLLGQAERGRRLLFESHEILNQKFGPEHDQTRGALERIKKFFSN